MSTGTALQRVGEDADVQTRSPFDGFEGEAYESLQAPFQKAVVDWMRKLGPNAWRGMLINPRGCGLNGRFAFNKMTLESFASEQFGLFWESLTDDQQQLFGRRGNRMGWRHFFLQTAFAMFDATLMNGIEMGMLPHPDGKIIDPKRGADMPGSVENDCARAKGSIAYDLETDLAEHLKHYSSGNVNDDRAFMTAFADYLGLDESTAARLMARVLDHHGLPNTHKARRTYGALLHTALGQCYGIRKEYQRTTPEAVIDDQMRKWNWEPEYRRPPLLDAILDWSFDFYDPARIAAYEADLTARHPDMADPDHGFRLEEGQAIIEALQAFRTRLVGGSKVLESKPQHVVLSIS